jgi:hypothetical protein
MQGAIMQEGAKDVDKGKETENIKRRYRKLASRLATTGPIIQGTITERIITRPGGKRTGRDKTYGPYYQWTFKSAGKTATVNLTGPQAKLFQRAIENNQKLEITLSEMRRLSRQLCEGSAKGVKKRASRKPTQEP